MDTNKAFSGLKVLDLTQGVAGPHATMLLALNGAEVTKIEPIEGDWCRRLGKHTEQESVNFYAYNRGKRSIALDLKSASGHGIAMKLARASDILVESFRPGVVKRMKLDYGSILSANKNIIYASISGFGQTGAASQRATVDALIQAYSGMMTMNASNGAPHKSGMIIVDVVTGMYAYQAICAAVIRRMRFGQGENLDINMVQSAAAFQAAKIMEFVEAKGKPQPLYVPAGMFATSDGHIVVSGMRVHHFSAICDVLGIPSLATDPRWPTQQDRTNHGNEINAALQARFLRGTSDKWVEKLRAAGVMTEKVLSYGEWLEQEHVKETSACSRVETESLGCLPVPRVPGVLPFDDPAAGCSPPPLIGEHSIPILEAIGYDEAWIAGQIEQGTVRTSCRRRP